VNLLAIDSSCSILSAAVYASRTDEIFCEEAEAGLKHSELVMGCIENQMAKAGLKPAGLDGVLCMGGPGSFTGLRIGYSIAKGLALSLSIPFSPIPTLDCIAFSFAASQLTVPLIQARKGSFFFTIFRGGSRLLPDTEAGADQIAEEIKKHAQENEKITITGPGSTALYDSLPNEQRESLALSNENRGYAKELILIAKKTNIFANDNTAYLYSGPEYIRKTDAEINLG